MGVHTFPAVEEHRGSLPLSLAPQPFPKDAHAVIYRPSRSAMTSGKARTREWKLRFDRRTPPLIESWSASGPVSSNKRMHNCANRSLNVGRPRRPSSKRKKWK